MKVLPFENGVSEKLEQGDENTQNISKVTWSAHKEFSNADCPITLSTLDCCTISILNRNDNFT